MTYRVILLSEEEKLAGVREFVAEVERRAEAKMLKTGKLEGAHYAAMKELLTEMERRVAEEAD